MDNVLNITMLKHKKLRSSIRDGITTEELCAMYNCDEEAVNGQIDSLYSNNLDQGKKLKSQLAKNDKKARRNKRFESLEKGTTEEGEKVRKDKEAEIIPNTSSAAGILTSIVAKRKNGIRKLEKVELAQSNEVIRLEANNTALRGEITSRSECLGTLGTDMRELIESYDKKYDRFKTEAKELNELIEQRKDNLSKLSGAQVALDETRQKTKELNKLSVFVYASGDIVVIDGDDEFPVSEFEGSNSVYRGLLAKPDECGELRLKDITTLANLIALREISPLEIDLTCDVDEIAEAFSSLS